MDLVIKLDYFRESAGGNSELLMELGAIYLKQVEEIGSEMEQSLAEKDWQRLSKLAHKAKYSAAVVGLTKLSEYLQQLESDARNSQHEEDFVHRVNVSRKNFELASNELKKLIPGI